MMTRNPKEIVELGAALLAELNPASIALRAAGEMYCAAIQERATRERMHMEMDDARRRALELQRCHELQMKHNA